MDSDVKATMTSIKQTNSEIDFDAKVIPINIMDTVNDKVAEIQSWEEFCGGQEEKKEESNNEVLIVKDYLEQIKILKPIEQVDKIISLINESDTSVHLLTRMLENLKESLNDNSGINNDQKENVDTSEWILAPENERNLLFPVPKDNMEFWNMYKDSVASFWVPEEIDFSEDARQWDNLLNEDDRNFLELYFSFFLVFDQIVIKNLESGFTSAVTMMEAKMFYAFQEMMENFHVETYALFPEKIVRDPVRVARIKQGLNIPVIGRMADWATKWIKSGSWVHRLLAFAIIEGVFFSGAFSAIFYMKKQGKLPGLAQANELIARDEGMHRDFAILMYATIDNKIPIEEFKEMLNEAVELVVDLNTKSISVDMIGMNCKMMNDYIKYIADCLAVKITGYSFYAVENPFPWMDLMNLQGKTNFFDRKVTQYARQIVLTDPKDNIVTFDAPF